MLWTLLSLLCVLATKFLTAIRLRGLKARYEAAQPVIDEIKRDVGAAEEKVEELRLQVAQKSDLLNALEDVVRLLEESLKQPPQDLEAMERVQLMETVDRQNSVR